MFIEFTLSAVLDTIVEQDKHQVKHQVDLTGTQIDVLKSLQDKTLSRKEIFAAIGMNGDSRSFKRHIEPLIVADERTGTLKLEKERRNDEIPKNETKIFSSN